MRTRLFAIAAGLLGTLVATPALAQDSDGSSMQSFGARGPNVIVLDNAGGFLSYNVSDENGEHGNPQDAFGVFTFPPMTRLGYHRFFGQLSIGAGVHLSKTDLGVDLGGLGASGSATIFGFAPRVGYAFPLSSTFAFWLRGGVSLTYVSADKSSTTYFGPAGEGFFVYTPVRNFGIEFGPVAEYGISGSVSPDKGNSQDVRFRSYGFTVGLLVDF